MRILVAEDDHIFANTIEILVEELGYELVKIVDNAEEMLSLIAATKPDLVLLDIHLKGIKDGIDVANSIANSKNPMPVIFITSFQDKETFERAKNTNPFAFIIKPFDELTLQRSIELALYKYANATLDNELYVGWQKDLVVQESFFVKIGQKLEKIRIIDIHYIEIVDKYAELHTNNQKLAVRMALKELLVKLPSKDFLRVNRNLIINANHIEHINLQDHSIKVGAIYLTFSRRFKDQIVERLNLLQ
jgi:DNA-binding LytR/AlgR family response regulator